MQPVGLMPYGQLYMREWKEINAPLEQKMMLASQLFLKIKEEAQILSMAKAKWLVALFPWLL